MKEIIKFMNSKRGFTLAEVLITLTIIGVVAAMTIPTLISQQQKRTVVESLKENYSILNQALLRSAAESNSSSFGVLFNYGTVPVGTSPEAFTTSIVKDNLIPYLKLSKDCGWSTGAECGMPLNKFRDGTTINYDYNTDEYRFFLQNGASLIFIPDNDGTNWTNMLVTLDINGNQQPNTYGKDIFILYFTPTSNKVSFFGANGSRTDMLITTGHGCSKTSTGLFCGALIHKDGWQIADDYPW